MWLRWGHLHHPPASEAPCCSWSFYFLPSPFPSFSLTISLRAGGRTDPFHPLYNTIKNSLYHRNTSAFILIAKLFQDNGTMEKMVNLMGF